MLATIYISQKFFFNSLTTSHSNIQLHDRNSLKVGFCCCFEDRNEIAEQCDFMQIFMRSLKFKDYFMSNKFHEKSLNKIKPGAHIKVEKGEASIALFWKEKKVP